MKGLFVICSVLLATVQLARSAPIGTCPPDDPPESVYLQDDQDCSIFYRCSSGVPIEFQCPLGLYFNPDTNSCDWPANVNCILAQVNTDNDNGPWIGKCPEMVTTQLVLLASRNDPTKFYSCVGDTPYELSCPSGLVFNVNLQVCDYPQ